MSPHTSSQRGPGSSERPASLQPLGEGGSPGSGQLLEVTEMWSKPASVTRNQTLVPKAMHYLRNGGERGPICLSSLDTLPSGSPLCRIFQNAQSSHMPGFPTTLHSGVPLFSPLLSGHIWGPVPYSLLSSQSPPCMGSFRGQTFTLMVLCLVLTTVS